MAAVKSQGTDLFAIDPEDGTILDVGCITSISGIDTSIEQVETTCLNDSARSYIAGLGTPGTATFGIQTDPQDPVHVRLLELKNAGATLQWAIGWSDGEDDPTVGVDDDFDLPATRSWLTFEGYMNSYPFEFALNAVVTSNIGIQVSGDPVLVPKSE